MAEAPRREQASAGATTVHLDVAWADAELAADRLWALGASAIEERPSAGGRVQLIAGFSGAAEAEGAVAALQPDHRAVVVDVVDDGWADEWRRYAGPRRAGRRFLLVPAWDATPEERPDPEVAASDADVVVRIDPGRAFGSGSHPTTRAVLAAVERLVTPGTSVLDVGCGSGVLAVASALLGASPVTAIDIDPSAIAAAAANVARNGLPAGAVDVSPTPLTAITEPCAVVLANLLAGTIASLAGDLARLVAPEGALVLSGLLADRWPATASGFPGWTVGEIDGEDGWVAVTLRRA